MNRLNKQVEPYKFGLVGIGWVCVWSVCSVWVSRDFCVCLRVRFDSMLGPLLICSVVLLHVRFGRDAILGGMLPSKCFGRRLGRAGRGAGDCL